MKIIDPNWKEAATKHYSTIALYVICALILIPELLFLAWGMDLNPVVIGRWLIAAAIFGIVGKVILQVEEGKWTRRVIIAVCVLIGLWASFPAAAKAHHTQDRFDAIAFDLISEWEGKRNAAYLDIVGVPTICYGHTRTARLGQYKTDAECRDLLIQEIAEYREGLHTYFAPETLSGRLTAHRDAAYTSLAFNVGIRAAGRSTATRRLNRGDIRGGCEALTWWKYGTVQGEKRVIRGLFNRRLEEKKYCLRGLT